MSYVRTIAVSLFAISLTFSWIDSSYARAFTFSRSLGAPNRGRLENGVRLEPGTSVRIVGAYANGNAQWGTRELVELIQRASRAVKRQYKDAVLGVGHLSRKGGGPLERHNSHTSGRDADIALYLVDSQKKSVSLERFVTIDVRGVAKSDPRLRFDEQKNWAFVAALAQDNQVRVTHIFIAHHLRARLLSYATRNGVSPQLRDYVSQILMQPRNALPHDDHMHIRVACPNNQTMCVEYPWIAHKTQKAKQYLYAKTKTIRKIFVKKPKIIRASLQVPSQNSRLHNDALSSQAHETDSQNVTLFPKQVEPQI